MTKDLPQPATSEAELITDIGELVKNFRERTEMAFNDYSPGKAAHEFFLREVSPVCAYKHDQLVHGPRGFETILVGTWSSHAETGLYVRIETTLIARISLAKNYSVGGILAWNYEWLGNNKEKGLLYLGVGMNSLSLHEIKEAYDLARKFTQALEGYQQIVEARK